MTMEMSCPWLDNRGTKSEAEVKGPGPYILIRERGPMGKDQEKVALKGGSETTAFRKIRDKKFQ